MLNPATSLSTNEKSAAYITHRRGWDGDQFRLCSVTLREVRVLRRIRPGKRLIGVVGNGERRKRWDSGKVGEEGKGEVWVVGRSR